MGQGSLGDIARADLNRAPPHVASAATSLPSGSIVVKLSLLRRAARLTGIVDPSSASPMKSPQVRPGRVRDIETPIQVVAFFYNSAPGNLVVQILTALGVPSDRLGVTPPERIDGGQGMVLSIACADEKLAAQVETICREQGAEIHRQRR
jgi:hypothetical protein